MYTSVMDEGQEDVDEMERVQSVNHSEEIYDCFVQDKRLESIVFLLLNNSKRALVLRVQEDVSVPEETLDKLEM